MTRCEEISVHLPYFRFWKWNMEQINKIKHLWRFQSGTVFHFIAAISY